MTLSQLFEIRENLINEAIKHSKTLPECEQNQYVNVFIEAAVSFYAHAMITIIDTEMEDKPLKSA